VINDPWIVNDDASTEIPIAYAPNWLGSVKRPIVTVVRKLAALTTT
jgi:hypothetical protein